MKIGMFTLLFNDRPLEEVADYAASLGYESSNSSLLVAQTISISNIQQG